MQRPSAMGIWVVELPQDKPRRESEYSLTLQKLAINQYSPSAPTGMLILTIEEANHFLKTPSANLICVGIENFDLIQQEERGYLIELIIAKTRQLPGVTTISQTSFALNNKEEL